MWSFFVIITQTQGSFLFLCHVKYVLLIFFQEAERATKLAKKSGEPIPPGVGAVGAGAGAGGGGGSSLLSSSGSSGQLQSKAGKQTGESESD